MLEIIAQAAVNHLQAQADAKFQERVYGRASGSNDRALEEWKAAYYKLEATNNENYKNAVINRAMHEADLAQIKELSDALRAVAPNHPTLATSGLKFKDGRPKSKLRILWENTFDARLRLVGGFFGANPKAYRVD